MHRDRRPPAPAVKDFAHIEADRLCTRVNSHGEVLADVKSRIYRGMVGEGHHHWERGLIVFAAWKARRDELFRTGAWDDGGCDTDADENIKVVRPGDGCVFVSDDRAATYIVYEYDPRGLIRYLGSFIREQIHPVTGGRDTHGRGVYRSELA